ncbi:hypothetical protein RRG08_054622 [Elysia crispata]|uniref:Uncharacterized protein n=1 Tax=Elysia crispata TaxID=231223 RepID=A0AAE1E7U6_9GAST|nr:hypothetical protein RRG08_054622 [Elysia crispata]
MTPISTIGQSQQALQLGQDSLRPDMDIGQAHTQPSSPQNLSLDTKLDSSVSLAYVGGARDTLVQLSVDDTATVSPFKEQNIYSFEKFCRRKTPRTSQRY